ncbi:hypothetical protein ACIQBJ_04545 [Kitasatospora sp. NPDC088391]|uniref:hypothetical protein n=1 Tax=Kitasatospora sp. NPDC088391 TaxID=3364074 RepID=UPI003813F1DD
MTTTARPTRLPAALAALFLTAFVLLPGAFTDPAGLRRALPAAFVGFWRAGRPDLPPALRELVDAWARYHLVKAACAAGLLAALTVLAARLRTAYLASGRRRTAAAGLLAAAPALGALAALLANVQGAIAPLSSLLSALPADRSGELATAVGQLEQELADGRGPAAGALTADFARYHLVIALAAALLTLLLLLAGARTWRSRRTAPDRRARRLATATTAACALLAAACAVLAAANTGVAADPAPALLAFFRGGW